MRLTHSSSPSREDRPLPDAPAPSSGQGKGGGHGKIPTPLERLLCAVGCGLSARWSSADASLLTRGLAKVEDKEDARGPRSSRSTTRKSAKEVVSNAYSAEPRDGVSENSGGARASALPAGSGPSDFALGAPSPSRAVRFVNEFAPAVSGSTSFFGGDTPVRSAS